MTNNNGFANTALRRSINIKSVLMHFGIKIEDGKCLCPFHDDHDPSMVVNDESTYCFACARGWGLVEFVESKLDISTEEAYKWLEETELVEVESAGPRKRGEYRGPVNPDLIDFWHNCLQPEHREILYQTRLLTDETINLYKLGWRPDYKAFVIPFWSGIPQQSEIGIVQFRKTNESPSWLKSKFTGMSGHNKPMLICSHSLIKASWGMLLFGTFDALLAWQDGFPVASPNGVSVFTRTYRDELLEHFKHLDVLFVVKDATKSEEKAVNIVVEHMPIPCVVKQFPDDLKDYNDYRLVYSRDEFIKNILGFSWL